MSTEIPEHVARLLTSSIETVERLDILLLLRRARPKTFTARAVATELWVSAGAAESALALLCGRGFLTVSIASDLFYSYAPVTPSLDATLESLMKLVVRDRPRLIELLRAADGAPEETRANTSIGRKKNGA